MKKKELIIKLTSYLAAAALIFCGFIISGYTTAAKYRTLAQNNYSSAIADLAGYMENISTTLEKEMYCADLSQLAVLSNRLSADTACAKSALKNLPVSEEYTSGIYRFLSQAGDFSLYLSKKSADDITGQDSENLKSLYSYSKTLSSKISDIQALAAEDKGYWSSELKNMLANAAGGTELSALNKSAEDISSGSDSPKLIYDGPFSDHMMQRSPKYIEGMSEISKDAARSAAAKYFDCDEGKVQYDRADNGNVKAYILRYGTKTAAVTETGGALLYMTDTRDVLSVQITADEAVSAAREWLTAKFGMDFRESYYIIDNDICTVNFAYYEDGVTYYPDLIKVSVALDDGGIVGAECGGFVMNHHNRNVSFSADDTAAKAKLSPLLTAEKSSKCVINTGTDTEYCCYEFVCSGQNGEDILVYIDAVTLAERNILILLKTDGGTLTK